jgi:hypothetical protein
MKPLTISLLLAFWLIATPQALQAGELPVYFTKAGLKTTISVSKIDGEIVENVALWTFGQPFGKPIEVKEGAVEITAPKVRVPVVFRLKATNDDHRDLAELIVYPDRTPVKWNKDTQLVAAAAPEWFNAWAEIVGLPIKKLDGLESLDDGNWRMREKRALLVVRGEPLRNNLTKLGRLAADHETSVLVLAGDWFADNESVERPVTISPKSAFGPLVDLQGQTWAVPPMFHDKALCVVNRQTWLSGPEHPLVEEIRTTQEGAEKQRTVVDYVAWQRMLGRCEMADELLLRMLQETAKGAGDRRGLNNRWCLLYPPAKEIKPAERPVLAAAIKSAITNLDDAGDPSKIRAYVLDLRGGFRYTPGRPGGFHPGESFGNFFLRDLNEKTGAMKLFEETSSSSYYGISPSTPLLILGNHPVLDNWKWLDENDPHRHHPSPAAAAPPMPPRVIWLPDNALPASMESELRLMQLFTEWNVFLETNSKE